MLRLNRIFITHQKITAIKSSCYPIFLILLLVIFSNVIIGQEPSSWHITDEEGLPSINVYRTIQDQKGYMWMGTESGICRFDGKNFKRYSNNLLNDNEILVVFEDSNGRIWFSNLSNQIFYIENERIHPFPLVIEDVNNIRDISIINNQIFLLVRFNTANTYEIVQVDVDGELNILGQQKLNYLKNSWGYFSYHEVDQLMLLGSNQEKERGLFCINMDNQEYDLIYNSITDLNYFKYIGEIGKPKEAIKEDMLQLNTLLNMYSTKGIKIEGAFMVDTYFMIFSRSTLYIHSKANQKETEELELQHVLKKIYISDVTKDKEGNYWISTIGKGIYVIPSMDHMLYTTNNSILSDNYIHSLGLVDSSRLLVGSSEGRVAVIEDKHIARIVDLKINSKITPILTSPYGTTYFGTKEGIIVADLKLNEQNLIHPAYIKSFIWKDDNLWVGTSSSTYEILLKTKYHTEKYIKRQVPYRILKIRTYALHEDFNTKKLWIGTTQGLYTYINEENPKPFLEQGKHNKYRISDITQALDSTIWIATHNDGILGIKNDSIYHRFNEDNFLRSNFCKTLLIDENDMLWIGTDKGLIRLNLNNHSDILLIDKMNGLPVNEVTAIIAFDELLWVGTPKGLVSFDTEKITPHTNPPPIHITAFSIWEKDTTLTSSYTLDYHQNNIKIDYLGLSYSSRGILDYDYRMIGIDTNWVETKTTFVRFPSLSSGKYTFEVRAKDKNGNESLNTASINILIRSAWWTTRWFQLFLILLVLIFFYILFRFFDQKQKRGQEIKKRINTLKMEALQAQMNPHFVFNAMYAIQNFLIKNKQEEALIYLARFAKLIRLIFEHSRKQFISFEEEIEFIRLYLDLEKLRFRDKIEIELHITPKLKEKMDSIQIPPLLIQPIIENSFKHGLMHKKEKGILKISFKEENNFLHCVVEDNGVGRKLAQELNQWQNDQHQPSGIETTKQRLQFANQSNTSKNIEKVNDLTIFDLHDHLGNPCGTKVDIEIRYI